MKFIDDPRRQFLIKALSMGAYAVTSAGFMQPVWAMGKVPKELVPGKSIYDLKGTVKVNGKQADEDTFISENATVETGANSHVIFAVGKDAFILRDNSKLKLEGEQTVLKSISLLTGKLLSVFGKRAKKEKLKVSTSTATIGIRGTGVYVESEQDKSYVCTCYGTADLQSNTDTKSIERVVSKHHDSPRYVMAKGAEGEKIKPAPMKGHDDDELALIEALVGRTVPFASGDDYNTPRKSSY